MEIKDNELLRHFETMTSHGLLIIEYAVQDRKIFLTKINEPEDLDQETLNSFIVVVLDHVEAQKFKVVPTHPRIVSFFRKNPKYKELLPPGIKI